MQQLLIQIPIVFVLVALATYIGEGERAGVESRKLKDWHWWHAGLPNAQWAFASFYVAVFWIEKLQWIRGAAFALFCASVIAYGFSTRFATRILKTEQPKCYQSNDERLNNVVALVSLIVVIVYGLGAPYFE